MFVDETRHLIDNGWSRCIKVFKDGVNHCADIRTFWYAGKRHGRAQWDFCPCRMHMTAKEIWLLIEARTWRRMRYQLRATGRKFRDTGE